MRKLIVRIIKEPLLHFMLLGACIYGAYALFGTPEADDIDTSIHVDSKRIDAFISEWQSRRNRPPTAQEIDGLIQQFINEEVLYRQAVAMGLNENDPITRRRMAQKLEFLTSDLAQAQQPTDAELEKYFQDNMDAYRGADLITFIQVFFDPDKRDEKTLDDAAKAMKELQLAGEPDPEKLEAGDRFMLQNLFKSADESQVKRQLGSGFTESLMKLEQGKWHGPVLSGYGVHLVYVYKLEKAPAPDWEKVKATVLESWNKENREKFNAEFLEALKKNYEIVIDDVPADRLIDGDAGKKKEVKTEGEESSSK